MLLLRKVIAFGLLSCLPGLAVAGVPGGSQAIPPKYEAWLTEDVTDIITAKEKDVFLKLATDTEREFFIEAFWRQRDPIPETPENEFREEHYRRIQYANANFGKGTSRPGRKTDRGKIYTILGKPVNVVSYGSESSNLVPIEVWFYNEDFKAGLPSTFYVVFFQEDGLGDRMTAIPIGPSMF
jgi:GWxTD domain-containing protein